MHKEGYIHYDLKPENILIGNEKCTIVKLSDFSGLYKIKNSYLMIKGINIINTKNYVAPEVL